MYDEINIEDVINELGDLEYILEEDGLHVKFDRYEKILDIEDECFEDAVKGFTKTIIYHEIFNNRKMFCQPDFDNYKKLLKQKLKDESKNLNKYFRKYHRAYDNTKSSRKI